MLKKLSEKKYILLALGALVLCALGALLLPRLRPLGGQSEVEVVERLVSGTVECGDIERRLIGGGTIADEGSKTVSLAGDIEFSYRAVSNGDYIRAGQLIAAVDKAEVFAAIEELNDLIKALDAAIEASRYDVVSSRLTAPRDGRVKAIYAQVGDSVATTVGEYGALMLLSLDGRMAVQLDAGSLTLGSGVSVTLESGETLAGVVQSVTEGVATVTVSDETAAPGEKVTVSVAGESVGSGELYIHSELKLTGFTGTVSAVNVAVNTPVSASNTLITLADTEYSGNYDALLAQRRKLEAQMQRLFAAYEQGGVYAELSGRVSGLDEALDYIPGASAVSALTPAAPVGTRADNPDTPAGSTDPDTPTVLDGTYMGRVSKLTVSEAGDTVVTVSPTGCSELNVALSTLDAVLTGSVKSADIALGDIIALQYTQGVLTAATVYKSDASAAEPSQPDTPQQGGNAGGMSAASAMGGMGGGMSAAGGADSSASAKVDPADYSMAETVLCSVTPYERANITVTVDELDIRALSVGEEVSVTLDALPAQSFTAVISEIDPVGEYSGGSTKYSVTVTLPREENMLTGMNAAVYAVLDLRRDVPYLPLAALNEDSEGVFVYTAYSARDDELSSPVYVTTGISDGERVELLSGLEEGDVYYYRYADTISYTFG